MKHHKLITTKLIRLIILLLTGYQSTALASSLYSSTKFAGLDYSSVRQNICYENTTSTSAVECQGGYNVPDAVTIVNYGSSATSDYGVLKAYTEVSVDQTDTSSGGWQKLEASSISSFRDQWTITGGELGTTGTLDFVFDLTGSSGMYGAGMGWSFVLRNYTDNTVSYDHQLPGNTAYLSTDFIFGEVVDYEITLSISAWVNENISGGYSDGVYALLDY